jgi:electron transfer flavoprotein beta subunit
VRTESDGGKTLGLNCIVLVREVWDTRDLVGEIANSEGELNTGRLTTRFEPEDLNALEMALQVKDEHGGTVTAIAVGASRQVDVLRECLYRGVDQVCRVVDAAVEASDTRTKAEAVATAVRKAGVPDLLLCGLDVVEGENSQLGVEVACRLGLPRANYVDRLEAVGDGSVTCVRAVEGGYETVRLALPAALIVGVALLKEDPRAPRSAKARLKLQMKKTPIEQWDATALGLSVDPAASGLSVSGYEAVPQRDVQPRRIEAGDEGALKQMVQELKA